VQNEDEEKNKELKTNLACSYLGIGWSNLLQIWHAVYFVLFAVEFITFAIEFVIM